jgi:hypothetical protein
VKEFGLGRQIVYMQARHGVAIQSDAGCRGDALLAMTKVGSGGRGGMVPLDCRVGALPLLAMTKGGENLTRNDVKSEIAWLQTRALGNTGKHAGTNFIAIMKGKHKIGPAQALHYLVRSAPFSLDLPSDT